MDAQVNNSETLPWIAEQVAKWVPELKGRAIAVTDADVRKDNVPTLPLAMVAPLIQRFTHNGGYTLTVVEEFVIEVWLEPAREKSAKGETPFWSYYEYNKFRDRLFSRFAGERTPGNGRIEFISMDVESNFLATVLTFRMSANYDICADADELEDPAKITFSLCQPRAGCLPPEPVQEKDPCQGSM